MNNLSQEIYARNYGVVTHEEQQKLTNAKVTVIGAGGVGGITLISLARMGFGNIQVVDMDEFDYSKDDLNSYPYFVHVQPSLTNRDQLLLLAGRIIDYIKNRMNCTFLVLLELKPN